MRVRDILMLMERADALRMRERSVALRARRIWSALDLGTRCVGSVWTALPDGVKMSRWLRADVFVERSRGLRDILQSQTAFAASARVANLSFHSLVVVLIAFIPRAVQ